MLRCARQFLRLSGSDGLEKMHNAIREKQLRLLQKSVFVIPEVFIGNPVFFRIKDFWIPAFAGMTTIRRK